MIIAIRFSAKLARKGRAFVNFSDSYKLLEFVQRMTETPFLDERGAEVKLQIELAPSQMIPKEATKQDPLVGTLEEDEEFKCFLEQHNVTEGASVVSLDEQIEQMITKERQLNRKAPF